MVYVWAWAGVSAGYTVLSPTLTFVRIISHTGVCSLVRSREGNEVGRGNSGAAARDVQLVAARVELGPWIGPRSMQGDNLVAHKVEALLQAGRNRVCVRRWGGHQGGLYVVSRSPYPEYEGNLRSPRC